MFIHCNVSRKPDVEALVQKSVEAGGRIDVLVNDAGVCPFWDFGTMPEHIWDQVLDVNLKGAFLCSQAVSRVMV